ncbi:hypothetical protein N7509_012838 [Penicillium cosmopolitanum]|uniref:Uncharacterized protein n=1 Tax=Penicillium cosmopolitanum TaxID=1131564 RepID=A0A9W9SC53_9EURO|nr:uncharacterized protein N7509_012838 [Penicillium cosmopolitanum]KAJ5375952.1 hypothetical protein N7509_012838 [Penicillium cosmopolitanum]
MLLFQPFSAVGPVLISLELLGNNPKDGVRMSRISAQSKTKSTFLFSSLKFLEVISKAKLRELKKINILFFTFSFPALTPMGIFLFCRNMVKSEPHGLTWEVVQRLSCLKQLEESLGKEDNDNNHSNVKSIIAAYRSKNLHWNENAVTYWSYGQLIAGPKKLDIQELYALSAKYGPKGFWVEGIDGFRPGHLYVFLTLNSRHNRFALQTVHITIRKPATQATSTMATTLNLDFLEDSGSSTMRIVDDDKNQLETLSGGTLPILGKAIKQTAMGQI